MNTLSSSKGAAAVEMAIILPLLIMLTFGLIEFGLLMYNQQVITNAAREGARFGIVQATPRIGVDVIASTVHGYADAHLVTFALINEPPAVNVPNACVGFGDDLSVSVTYPYSFLVASHLIPGLSNLITLRSVSVMKCE
ncbi:MAG: TadE family protein [Syntrophorhabdaceae bacterium]